MPTKNPNPSRIPCVSWQKEPPKHTTNTSVCEELSSKSIAVLECDSGSREACCIWNTSGRSSGASGETCVSLCFPKRFRKWRFEATLVVRNARATLLHLIAFAGKRIWRETFVLQRFRLLFWKRCGPFRPPRRPVLTPTGKHDDATHEYFVSFVFY